MPDSHKFKQGDMVVFNKKSPIFRIPYGQVGMITKRQRNGTCHVMFDAENKKTYPIDEKNLTLGTDFLAQL